MEKDYFNVIMKGYVKYPFFHDMKNMIFIFYTLYTRYINIRQVLMKVGEICINQKD